MTTTNPFTLPLSKTMNPEDLKLLKPQLEIVDSPEFAEALGKQHPARRWEYGMALLAKDRWRADASPFLKMRADHIDVGGAGSPLSAIFIYEGWRSEIVDPTYNFSIEKAMEKEPRLKASVVTCISVIEHVARAGLPKFIEAVAGTVLDGGLLFLTCDYIDGPVQVHDPAGGAMFPLDTYHFAGMRSQIFNAFSMGWLKDQFEERGLRVYGGWDLSWNREQVYDYSFASLCMRKESAR